MPESRLGVTIVVTGRRQAFPNPGNGRRATGLGILVTGFRRLESRISNARVSHRLAAPRVAKRDRAKLLSHILVDRVTEVG